MEKGFYCSPQGETGKSSTVAETAAGRIRGFRWDGIYTFHGIRYATAKRFQKPIPVEKWDGTVDAMSYGYTAPKSSERKPNSEVRVVHRMWASSEDCLSLNIWTPEIHDEKARPVLVWLHGGGFFSGSSIEQVCYDGKSLAAVGDVVVVTVNHRLNVLGFLDMSPYGPQFENSANAGLADLVEALRWIRRNIRAFGGDPSNVTLFGQSGGAMKVMCLAQIPEARDLFHKGVMISGTFPVDGPRCDREIIDSLLRYLNFAPDEAAKLAEVPLDTLMEACRKTENDMKRDGLEAPWYPCRNNWYLGNPLECGFTEDAKRKPMIMAGVFSELNYTGLDISDKWALTRKQRLERLKKIFGERAEELATEFLKVYPDKNELDLLRLDNFVRMYSIAYLNQRTADNCAPTYDMMFTPEFPLDNGSPAWHCSDLPFFFHNIDMVPVANGPENAKELEHQISGALLQFARTGNPNGPGLLNWPEYQMETKPTLVLDTVCRVGEAYDHGLYAKFSPWTIKPENFWTRKKNNEAADIT